MRDDFAVFIMVHGRPDQMWTLGTMRKHGYTGKIYFVGDDLDATREGYEEVYGDSFIVFDKEEAAELWDSGDNSGDLRSTLYSANTIPKLAKERGLSYYMIVCDDYTYFNHNFDDSGRYYTSPMPVSNLDAVIEEMIRFYDDTNILTIAMSQGGDFIGGAESSKAYPHLIRKAMNTFLCHVDNPIRFMGRLNEDVTTYVNLGRRGEIFFTLTDVAMKQKRTQSVSGGLTEVYVDAGTYVKSFFSVMYNPSCVKISMMGDKNPRIHHQVSWKHAVPKIVREDLRKGTRSSA